MKNKNSGLLLLVLAISSGTQLVNRFVVAIPDWLVRVLMILAVALLVIFIFKSFRQRK